VAPWPREAMGGHAPPPHCWDPSENCQICRREGEWGRFKMSPSGKFFGLSEIFFGLSEKYCPCPPPAPPQKNMGPTAPLEWLPQTWKWENRYHYKDKVKLNNFKLNQNCSQPLPSCCQVGHATLTNFNQIFSFLTNFWIIGGVTPPPPPPPLERRPCP
jgi:hypothetical protein